MSDNSDPQPDPAESTEPPQASSGTSPADADNSGETASPASETIGGISDDQLPEDLRPGDDNPLAEPLDPDDEATKSREDLEMDATQADLGNDDGASTAPDQEGDDVTGGGAGQATEESDAGTTDTSDDDA